MGLFAGIVTGPGSSGITMSPEPLGVQVTWMVTVASATKTVVAG